MHPASNATFRIPLDAICKKGGQDAQLMIDGSGLPVDRWSSFSGTQIDLARLVWVNRAGAPFGLCAKEGNVRFYRLGGHIVNMPACHVEPDEEVSEATCVGAQGVG